ncbi:MAG TPA: Gldg family protein [Acidimicrobiia bacterium]|nr:Gldg family protein [Acidimicrobiia bacterium]
MIALVTVWLICGLGLGVVALARVMRRVGFSVVRRGVLFLGVLVAVLVGLQGPISAAQFWHVDLTRSKSNTLSEATERLVRGLGHPVTITAFFDRNAGAWQEARRLLRSYEQFDTVKVKIVDPDIQLGLAQSYALQAYGDTFVEVDNRRTAAGYPEEINLSSAILRVSGKTPDRVCLIGGHGERAPEPSAGAAGISQAVSVLTTELYEVTVTNLRTADGLAGCKAALVVGAAAAPLPQEAEVWNRWLAGGGKAAVLLDDLASLGSWTGGRTEIRAGPGTVVDDKGGVVGDPSLVVVGTFPSFSPVVAQLAPVVLIKPQALVVDDPKGAGGVATSELITSSEAGAIEGNNSAGQGRRPLAAQIDASHISGTDVVRTRLLVIGDSDWMSNQVLGLIGNKTLLRRVADWLTEKEPLLTARARTIDSGALLNLTRSQAKGVLLSSVVGPPALMVVVGTLVVFRRRRA